ncbi:7-cyano-7-deazaguanine synthase QueC [Methanocaldococcus sp. 28A]
MKAITVLSGGLDSTVATLIAKDLGYEITAITFNYGQRAVKREINSAKKICEILGIEHIVVDLPFIKQFKKSSLITEKEIPSLKIEELDSKKAYETMKAVWVPARNLIMFSIASGFAEAFDAEKVFIGINKEEGVTFPDNTIEFVESLNKALEYGTLNKVKIEAPLYDKTKEEIVKIGHEIEKKLGVEVLKYSYSCYRDNGEDFLHCGKCESCMRRKRAFLMAGVEDKTKYIE